jgi:hypothetical protein
MHTRGSSAALQHTSTAPSAALQHGFAVVAALLPSSDVQDGSLFLGKPERFPKPASR